MSSSDLEAITASLAGVSIIDKHQLGQFVDLTLNWIQTHPNGALAEFAEWVTWLNPEAKESQSFQKMMQLAFDAIRAHLAAKNVS